MSPDEFKQLNVKFIDELRARIKAEGYTFEPRVLQQRGNVLIIQLSTELYQLYNDGNRANWDFVGYGQ